jgi:dTDP-4-dehydrorhamnose 3,5-epimerase
VGQVDIEGAILTPLKIISHPKGDVRHALKASEKSFQNFGEAYFSSVLNNDIKGWKKHKKMVLNLVVVSGEIKFVIFDDRENSKTKNNFFDVTLSLNNYQRLTVPAGVWMAFQGKSDSTNLLLNLASIEHDPEEAISKDIKEISYAW